MVVGKHLPSRQVVAVAVFLLGGRDRFVDTEDVAVKVNEIAPGRYTWKKYPTQVNLELIRVYLSDAKKKAKGVLLEGSGNEGWRLTARGLRVIEPLAKEFGEVDLSRTKTDVRRIENERQRLLSTSAFQKFHSGTQEEISRLEVNAFFRVDEYIDSKTRHRKISRILDLFGSDPGLGKLTLFLAEKAKSHE